MDKLIKKMKASYFPEKSNAVRVALADIWAIARSIIGDLDPKTESVIGFYQGIFGKNLESNKAIFKPNKALCSEF